MNERDIILRLLKQSGAMLVTRDYCEFDHHSITLEIPNIFGSPVEHEDFQALLKADYIECRDPEDVLDFGRHSYTISERGRAALAAAEAEASRETP